MEPEGPEVPAPATGYRPPKGRVCAARPHDKTQGRDPKTQAKDAAASDRDRRGDSGTSRSSYCAQAPSMQFGAPLWQPEASTHAGATSREVRQ